MNNYLYQPVDNSQQKKYTMDDLNGAVNEDDDDN
jgi:hypothetical protein